MCAWEQENFLFYSRLNIKYFFLFEGQRLIISQCFFFHHFADEELKFLVFLIH
jgi:hypothetical protein